MTLNFDIPAQNIVCFDLLNSTWEETYACILFLNIDNINIEFLDIKYCELHSDLRTPDSISKIYFENNYIVACVSFENHNDIQGICYSMDYELTELKPISVDSMNSKKIIKSVVSDFTINSNLNLSQINYDNLLSINDFLNSFIMYSFEKEIINIEVKDVIQINLEEFSKKFNTKVIFEKKNLKLNSQRFLLHSIYYRNQLPIAFTFLKNGKTFTAWNEEYLLSIFNIKPCNIILLSRKEELDRILDKISEFGLNNLSDSENKFLDSFNSLNG